MRRTTLLVPIPEAEEATARWWPSWDPPKARGIPAHVTILFPFVPARDVDEALCERLREAAAEVRACEVAFARVARFARTVYLAPDPAEPFVELVRQVRQRFPAFEPYGGAHAAVVPHLSVLTTADEDLLDRAAAEVAEALPLRTTASELVLMEELEHGGWQPRARFPLARRTARGGPGGTSVGRSVRR